MQTEPGKELAALMATGDHREAGRKAHALLEASGTSDEVRGEANQILRALRPDPVAIVLLVVTAAGLLLIGLSYLGS
jgi:hypothetical protein